MRLIAFSLWGVDRKYTDGALRNAELAGTIYPGWRTRFYVANNVPADVSDRLQRTAGVEIVRKPGPADWTALLWRFEAGHDTSLECVVFRDTDSRLNAREKAAVDAWLASDKDLHVMRDHPHHTRPILGGMWGVKIGADWVRVYRGLLQSFAAGAARNRYGTDEQFLRFIWDRVNPSRILVHDEFFAGSPFPTARRGLEFVGENLDEFDHPCDPSHARILQAALAKRGAYDTRRGNGMPAGG